MSPRTARIILAALAMAFVAFLVGVGEIVTFLLVIAVAVTAVAAWLGITLLVCRALDDD